MKIDIGETVGRHVPLALVAAVLLQGATVVWWASAKERDLFFMEQRISNMEASMTTSSEAQKQILERLARIEERVNSALLALDRIERQQNVSRR